MGINGLIQFLCARFPDSIVATPTLEGLGGTRIFVDCAILLRRNLHAAATAILSRRRLEYSRASEAERQFIDVRSIRNEICNHATKPLLRLNQQLRAVRSNGGTQATFVLGSSITVRDLYIASKTGSPDHATNVLDIRNQHLVPALRAFFERKASGRLYAAPSEKDMLMIAQRLTDAFARVEVRQPDIARRCVEFCDQEDDHVLSDDTNTIAYGAPNVIRDYFGRNVCNTINQRKMLQLMGLTRSQFIDFCILCGLEGTPLIPHIGPERAYRIISNFKTLEAFLESTVLESVLRAPNVAKSLEKRKISVHEFKQQLKDVDTRRAALNIRQAKI